LILGHYALVTDIVNNATIDEKVVEAGWGRAIVYDAKIDSACPFVRKASSHRTGDIIDGAARDVDMTQQSEISGRYFDAKSKACTRSTICDFEIGNVPVGLVGEHHGTAGDSIALDKRQRTGAVAANYDRAAARARTLGPKLAGPHTAGIEQDLVAGLERGAVHFGERLPRCTLAGSVIPIIAAAGVDVIGGA